MIASVLKTKTVVITNDGRDKGKYFLITEMSAMRAEKWAIRVFLSMAHAGVKVPPEIVSAGMAGLAVWGLESLTGVEYNELEPLLDEMMTCVQIVPTPSRPEVVRPLLENDVMEVSTLVQLRAEVFQLHVNFSLAGLKSLLTSAPASIPPGSSTTPTSQPQSA